MSTIEVRVPDIGDFKDVPVIEIFVKPGDTVAAEDSLVTLESDKATMDVPVAGGGDGEGSEDQARGQGRRRLADRRARNGRRREAGCPGIDPGTGSPPRPRQPRRPRCQRHRLPAAPAAQPAPARSPAVPAAAAPIDSAGFTAAHASPSVRRFARELAVDLARVTGTGPKGRILQEDVQELRQEGHERRRSSLRGRQRPGGGGLNLLPWPTVDFAKFGPVEARPLSRIKKISGANLARNWVMIPHVTQFDEADITDLEAFRVALNKENEKSGVKVTMLAFLIKASVAALKKFPDVNASLVSTPDGDSLVLKQYYHVGFAADTPNGLVVPVIRNADQKGVLAIAAEMAALSAKAREGKLGPADMQGGCFSISSLGGIGGTAFTPIINAPEVAILGVSKSTTKPIWDGKAFAPRLMVPLSFSYDHRVIDGASAARFTAFLATLLADMRRVML